MSNFIFAIEKINIYLLPLAVFFILISTAATNFFLILTVFIAFVFCIKNNSFDEIFKKDFFFKICFLIFFLFVIGCTYTIAEPNEALATLKKYTKILYIPFIYYYLKIFKNEKIVLNFFLFGTTLILILSYLKYFNIININNFYEYAKLLSITGIDEKIINTKSTVFQHYIVQGIVLSFYSFLCLFKAHDNNNFILYFLSALAFINVIFLNNSRAAYIIMLILLLLSFYKIITSKKTRIAIIAFLIVFMASNLSYNFKNRISYISSDLAIMQIDDYNSSVGMRYIWFKIGIHNILNEPIIGNGTGSFQQSTINYFKNNNENFKIGLGNFISNNPHSEFISISSQLGIIGLLSFFIFLYLLLTCPGGIMSVATSILVIVASLFNSVFYDNMIGLFLVIIIGLFYKSKFAEQN